MLNEACPLLRQQLGLWLHNIRLLKASLWVTLLLVNNQINRICPEGTVNPSVDCSSLTEQHLKEIKAQKCLKRSDVEHNLSLHVQL